MSQANPGWIGVDLDCTLAEYTGWKPIVSPSTSTSPVELGLIGPPVQPMLDRVKGWLADGIEVRIFTARVSDGRPETVKQIQDWCLQHIGVSLQVTNVKDLDMWCLFDDRAVAIEPNTGRILGGVAP